MSKRNTTRRGLVLGNITSSGKFADPRGDAETQRESDPKSSIPSASALHREAFFQHLVNRVARKADTAGTKISVAEVSRVLSIARDELHQMLGGKGVESDQEATRGVER